MTTLKPKTAYELLAMVADHIEEEPKRYHQNVWALIGAAIDHDPEIGFHPACDTVCCRAGWIVALADGVDAPIFNAARAGKWTLAFKRRAVELLGMDEDDRDIERLFGEFKSEDDASVPFEFFDDDEDAVVLPAGVRPGTPEYAKFGADGVRDFMEKHKAHLQGRTLKGV